MILPFLTLIAKPAICSLADSYKSHRTFLVATMFTYMLGFGGLAILPFYLDLENHTTDSTAWFFICILIPVGYVSAGVLFSLTDSLASNYASKNNTSYSLLRMWSTIGWGSGALLLMAIGETKSLPFRVPGLLILIVVSIIDMLIITLWRNKDDFVMMTGEPIVVRATNIGRKSVSEVNTIATDTSKKISTSNRDTLPNWIVKVSNLTTTNQHIGYNS